MSSRARHILVTICALAVYVLGAVAIAWLVYNNGVYPSGSDGMAHIYKGDVLYRDILAGTWWPYVDPMWYNGVEIMRYWAPLPVYALAGCQALAGGSPFAGYVLFCALVFFLGGLVWLYVGAKLGRWGMGAFIGVLWFFMPNNLLALFYEGNLPRSIALVLLPLLVYWAWEYMRAGDWKLIWRIGVVFALIALCHSGYAGMIAIAFVVLAVCYGIANRRWKRGFEVLLAIVGGYVAIGVWLVPSLVGGITSTSSSEVMATFFQSLWKTINPVERITTGGFDFYFGFAAFLLCAFGALCAKRKTMPFFWAALVILLLTSQSAYPVLAALPGGQYLWMLRFISIALAFALFGLLTWETLRKGLVVAFCVLLVLDCVPSLPLLYGDMSGMQPETRLAQEADETLISNAQAVTEQRLALIDGSSLGSTGAFLVSDFGSPSATSQGAGWQSAATASNIRQVNAAAEQGDFLYLFDRSLELGDDTVLVRTAFVKDYNFTKQRAMDKAAKKLGYKLVASNGDYRLYHLKGAPSSWGTVTKYEAIGIGTGAAALSLQYPSIEETSDANLNHYSYEDLAGYKTVYLSGFTYDDQQEAEDLVTRLSENGVRVVISADGIPVNKSSHDREFLGVRCNDVSFSNGYPELDTVVGKLSTALFPQDVRDWRTVYLEGLDESWGTFSMQANDAGEAGAAAARQLDFVGTVKNDNIVICGLNLGYYYSLTEDASVGKLLGKATGLSGSELPQREIVPVSVSYSPDAITVTTDRDDVNTTLAYHDEFADDAGARMRNHLVVVDRGTTTLTFEYPCLWQGIAASVVGVALLVLLSLSARRAELGPRRKRRGGAAAEPSAEELAARANAPVALLIPAYNPDEKLVALLREMTGVSASAGDSGSASAGDPWRGPIVVVNDGSDDACAPVFAQVEGMPGVTVLVHEENRGKGAGLKTGIAWVVENHPECAGVVTADADGQHRPDDIRAVAQALRENPDELVLGCRDFTKPDVPRRSSMGNQLARVLLRLSAGVAVSDTQTGLRGIPLSMAPLVEGIKQDGYELETYMLAEAHRRGIAFTEVPIATVYIDDNRSSHYHPVRDSLRIAVIFGKYALSSMSSSIVDLTLFTLLSWLLGGMFATQVAIPVATYAARVVSAGMNFTINRHLVFKTRGSILKYAVLCVFVVTASALLVTGITMLTGFNATIVKVFVDIVLFFANYALQRVWVFAISWKRGVEPKD